MFKLFVLGALATAIVEHRVRWDERVTVTAALKVGGSGTLQDAPDGTRLTVEQAAIKMISISDNTAADVLINLIGRDAVERQVRAWTADPSLDTPFLTVRELFALKYYDYPSFADRYLRLAVNRRAAYLASKVDPLPPSAERPTGAPRAIDSIEWFASAEDLCRAFSGLATLAAEPGLSPLGTVLSTNTGGLALSRTQWPRLWFKGGSEPGVLTLGYLARDARGQSFVVIALTEDPSRPVQEALARELADLDLIAGAFGLAEGTGAAKP
jgi:beta-lactamase class A